MIYLKEPITNRVAEFQSQSSIGAGFDSWLRLTESEITSYKLKKAKEAKIAQCKAYLIKEDWQALAFITRQREYDEGVEENRLLAVSNQKLIKDCETLEELNNINTDFGA